MSFARRSIAVVAVLSVTPLLAAPAAADPKDPAKVKCDDHPMRQPFVPWHDLAHYALATDGNFEKKVDDWALTGDARPVAGNETFFVGAKKDGRSLALPAHGTATSADICVGNDHPSLRFFLKRVDGPPTAVITLRASTRDPSGQLRTTPLTPVTGGSDWAPSDPVVVPLQVLGADTLAAKFTFTPSPGSNWRIDDVYVDPWRSR